jgi:hypothetical protein
MLKFRLFAFLSLFTLANIAYTQEAIKDSVYFNSGLEVFNKVKEI